MKNHNIATKALAIFVVLILCSCQGGGMSNQDVGVAAGAVAGGLLGSTIGKGSGRIVSSVVGAGAGAYLGNKIGSSMDQQARGDYHQQGYNMPPQNYGYNGYNHPNAGYNAPPQQYPYPNQYPNPAPKMPR